MNEKECTSVQFLTNYFFTILIGPEVGDAWSVGQLISINIGDIHVISNRTYCSDKIIHSTEIAHKKIRKF